VTPLSVWPLWVAALWWGSLTTLGVGVVPLLFATLPTPALAGSTAARLFEVQTWVSCVLGSALLAASRARQAEPAARARAALGFVLAGMLMALLMQFGVAPRIVARDNLRLWHTLGTAMYALQWFCAAASFWLLVRPARKLQP
jgi:uncharacterized membrane protein